VLWLLREISNVSFRKVMQVLQSFHSGFSLSRWCDYFLLSSTNTKLFEDKNKKQNKNKQKTKNPEYTKLRSTPHTSPPLLEIKHSSLSEERRLWIEKQIPNILDSKAVLVLEEGSVFPFQIQH